MWEPSLPAMGIGISAHKKRCRVMLGSCSSKEITRKLQACVETVKAHKRHLYSKPGIKSRSELLSIFLQAQNA
ncbi:response regulator transcription factor [Pseudomonas sp. ANT_H14]|nr:response regulator transcription factor [Pseudomonas sp. ANT_H4]KAA0954647.1 response regulator transcription factor [Pseudomonas sp. ANT_H14]